MRRLLPLAGILLLGLMLRLACSVWVQGEARRQGGPSARYLFPDSRNFDAFARSLLHGEYRDECNRRAWRTPLYALFLAGQYALLGDSPLVSRWLNNLLDLANIGLAYLLARRLASHRAGLLAALAVALDPFHIYFSSLVLAETMSAAAIMAAMLCLAALLHTLGAERTWRWAFACGLLLAAAALAKPSLGLLVILVAIYLLIQCAPSVVWLGTGWLAPRPAIIAAAIAMLLAGFALGMAPWWFRNYRVFGEAVIFSTATGYALYESNSPAADGGPNHGKISFPTAWQELQADLQAGRAADPRTELRLDRMLQQEAWQWMRAHPRDFFALLPIKLARTWSPFLNYAGAQKWCYQTASACAFLPVIIFAIYTLWHERSRWQEIYFLLLPAIYLSIIHSIFMGSVRYRFPAMAPLIALAALAIDAIWQQRSKAQSFLRRQDSSLQRECGPYSNPRGKSIAHIDRGANGRRGV